MPNENKSFRAVYKDDQDLKYSCPVERHENNWVMKTSDGFQAISFHFNDDVGGLLTFVEYREDPKSEDSRLHINRLPGESSFGALQRAYAEKEIVEQRKQRQAARSEIQNVPVDPAKIAAARAANNVAAEVKRPHRDAVIPAMTTDELEVAQRNKRF